MFQPKLFGVHKANFTIKNRERYFFYKKSNIKFSLSLKPGLHEPQLQVERSVTLVSSVVVERHRCALQVSSVARLQ